MSAHILFPSKHSFWLFHIHCSPISIRCSRKLTETARWRENGVLDVIDRNAIGGSNDLPCSPGQRVDEETLMGDWMLSIEWSSLTVDAHLDDMAASWERNALAGEKVSRVRNCVDNGVHFVCREFCSDVISWCYVLILVFFALIWNFVVQVLIRSALISFLDWKDRRKRGRGLDLTRRDSWLVVMKIVAERLEVFLCSQKDKLCSL